MQFISCYLEKRMAETLNEVPLEWNSVVGIATGNRLDDTEVGVRVPVGQEFSFLFFKSSRPALGPTQPPYPMGTRGSFPGGKVSGT
jgi:hypothetical protein